MVRDGRKLSEEHRRKLSEAKKGKKNPMYGKPRSKATKRKISKTMKGRKKSEEHRRKISKSLKGRRNQKR